MTLHYQFREDVPLAFPNADKADPDVIGRSLAQLREAHGERGLSTDAIWQAAKKPTHPLHQHFEWNVRKAAIAHWRDTSRRLVRSIAIVDDSTDEPPQRAWHSIKTKDGIGYHELSDVMREADLQFEYQRKALRDLMAWQERYKMVEKICGEAVETARRQLAARLAAGDARRAEREQRAV